MLSALIELSRPAHWVKNVFVFLPLPFAIASGARLEPVSFLLGLLGFCLANSAVYAFNDARDAERDRLHPRKRARPVASGRVSVRSALLWSALLFCAGTALSAASGHPWAVGVLLIYVAVNGAYCLGGKDVPLLDVFLLASGFVLRVLLGCALLDAVPSTWLLLCSSGLALFFALGKRRGDLIQGLDDAHRPSLAGYNTSFLEHAMTLTAGITLIAYALYSMEAEVLRPGREFAALPFVVFGILEYLRLAHVHRLGDAPVNDLFRSPILLICGAGWLLTTAWSVGIPF